jgi:hypothetical protein
MSMIHFNHERTQVRVDTTIKIIEKDGTEITAPVVVLISTSKVEEKHKHNIYRLVNGLFNKDFTLNRKPKDIPKKSWWKIW